MWLTVCTGASPWRGWRVNQFHCSWITATNGIFRQTLIFLSEQAIGQGPANNLWKNILFPTAFCHVTQVLLPNSDNYFLFSIPYFQIQITYFTLVLNQCYFSSFASNMELKKQDSYCCQLIPPSLRTRRVSMQVKISLLHKGHMV